MPNVDVLITGPLGVDTGETHATHYSKYGRGGYMTVADATERDAIPAERREAYMRVVTIDDGNEYILNPDLVSWDAGVDTSQFMDKASYDTGATGNKVDTAIQAEDSLLLGGSSLASILDRSNHTGSQDQSTITGLVAALADTLKISTHLGQAFGVPQLDSSSIIEAQYLPFSASAYLGTYDGSTNTPTLTNGVGTAGQYYIATVAGAAGPVTVAIADVVVYNGSTWEVGPPFTGAVVSVNGNTGAVTLDTSDISATGDFQYVTAAYLAALAGSDGVPSGANVYVTDSDARMTDSRTPSGAAGGDLTGTYPNPTVAANAITTAKILDLNVTEAKLAAGSVTETKIGALAVTNAKINDVDGSKITNGTVTDAKIASLAYAKLTGAPATLPPSGVAGGDLQGSYPNPLVIDMTIAGQVQGSVLTYNGSAWVQISPGTSGQFLKTQGAGAQPIWDNAPSGTGLTITKTTYAVNSAIGNTVTHARLTADSLTMTLPAAASYTGELLWIKDESGSLVSGGATTIDCAGADTFEDGVLTSTQLTTDYEYICLYTDGTSKWFFIT